MTKKNVFVTNAVNVCVVICLIITSSITAYAEQPDKQHDDNQFSLALGALASEGSYRGMDTDYLVLPFILYRTGRFAVYGPRMIYMISNPPYNVNALLGWSFMGYDADDSTYFDGMDDRDGTLELGLQSEIYHAWGKLSLEVTTDMLDEHSGHFIKAAYGYPMGGPKLQITPGVGVVWISENVADHYFGVRSREARADRPAYTVDDTMGWFISTSLTGSIYKNWGFFTLINLQQYSDEITDSPLIDHDYGYSAVLALTYTF